MSSIPVWQTPAGTLGSIPEGVFYQTPLVAVDPAVTISVIRVVPNGSRVTFYFSAQTIVPYEIGSTIIVSAFTGSYSVYNGTYTVINATTSSVTVTNSSTVATTTNQIQSVIANGSTVTFNFIAQTTSIPYAIGSDIIVTGFAQQGYNGTYTVINATTSSVTISNATTNVVTVYGSVTNLVTGTITNIPVSVYFRVIAGRLPPGIQINETGLLSGSPQITATIQGVPLDVSLDTTSKFAIRAYTERVVDGTTVVDRLADRTFALTITGQNAVTWTTPAGEIATYYDGVQITDLAVEYNDPDIYAINVVTLIAGALPPGLTISTAGIISGYIIPNPDSTETTTDYSFTLRVTNGIGSDVRTFSILVYSRSTMTADNTNITADNTFITADASPLQPPIITTPVGSIGSVRSDNFYAFQFTGLDFADNAFQFIGTDLPPGLTLDPNSGWLYGYIPYEGLSSTTYTFSIIARETDYPDVFSDPYVYSLTINGPVNADVVWLTDSNLGYIDNGATSTFYVKAVNVAGLLLQYQLESGSDSLLPQGLQLLPSGCIAGRVSFDTFAVDGGSTTFDVGLNTVTQPTTFDMVYTFTVNAYSVNGVVNVNKTFSITVVRRYQEPFDNLYIQAMPPFNDRAILDSLLQDTGIFPPALIYRYDDPNFGVARRVIYQHAYGLTAASLDEYVASLNLNHYWKDLTLGEIKTARALDDTGNVIYEVVYSEVVDNLVNNSGVSVGKQVSLAYPVNSTDSTEINIVYPNSLFDMRNQVIDTVGQISNVLPRWMLSRQANGQTLGFTNAWVIAYTNPGQSGQIAYNIQQKFGDQLNLIDFEVDRYELDNLLTKNWDRENQHWSPQPPTITTFDVDSYYQLTSFDGGISYAVGDQIRVLGSQIGGVNGVNDLILTVVGVNSIGTIQAVIYNEISPVNTRGDTYDNIAGTNISGVGNGATWNIESTDGIQTTFDGNSLQFIAPVDMYSSTQIYDKYLVFPKRNILQ